jgi:hypothetical protein
VTIVKGVGSGGVLASVAIDDHDTRTSTTGGNRGTD